MSVSAAVGGPQAQSGCCGIADIDVVIVFSGIVAGSEVNFQRAGGLHFFAVMRAGKRTVEQLDAVEVRGVGDTGDFRRHLLVFGFNNQTLGRIIGAGCSLFRQFFHTDQLLVDDLERAVRGLDQGNTVIGVTDPLVKGADFRTHQFANGKTGGVIRCCFHTKAGRQLAGGIGKFTVVGVEVTRGVHRHHVVVNDQRHNFHPP